MTQILWLGVRQGVPVQKPAQVLCLAESKGGRLIGWLPLSSREHTGWNEESRAGRDHRGDLGGIMRPGLASLKQGPFTGSSFLLDMIVYVHKQASIGGQQGQRAGRKKLQLPNELRWGGSQAQHTHSMRRAPRSIKRFEFE